MDLFEPSKGRISDAEVRGNTDEVLTLLEN